MLLHTCVHILAIVAGAHAEPFPVVFGGNYSNYAGGEFSGFRPPQTIFPAPLFIWLGDSFDRHFPAAYQQITYQMALRGFTSVSVKYGNGAADADREICEWGKAEAAAIFDGPGSALEALCNTKQYVDCSKGIAVAGSGAGGFLTLFAKPAQAITARLAFSVGMCNTPERMGCRCYAQAPCLQFQAPTDKTKQRLVTGADDLYVGGGSPSQIQADLKLMSDYDCGLETNCLQPDGSGYYIVDTSDYKNATCDKAYHSLFTTEQEVRDKAELLCDFLSGSEWGLASSFDWLAKTTSGNARETPALTFEGAKLSCAKECGMDKASQCITDDKINKLKWVVVICTVACCGCCCLLLCLHFCCGLGGPAKRTAADNDDGEDYDEQQDVE